MRRVPSSFPAEMKKPALRPAILSNAGLLLMSVPIARFWPSRTAVMMPSLRRISTTPLRPTGTAAKKREK